MTDPFTIFALLAAFLIAAFGMVLFWAQLYLWPPGSVRWLFWERWEADE